MPRERLYPLLEHTNLTKGVTSGSANSSSRPSRCVCAILVLHHFPRDQDNGPASLLRKGISNQPAVTEISDD